MVIGRYSTRSLFDFLATKRETKGRRRLFEGGINTSINAQLFFRHSLDAKTTKIIVALLFGGLKPIINEQKIPWMNNKNPRFVICAKSELKLVIGLMWRVTHDWIVVVSQATHLLAVELTGHFYIHTASNCDLIQLKETYHFPPLQGYAVACILIYEFYFTQLVLSKAETLEKCSR